MAIFLLNILRHVFLVLLGIVVLDELFEGVEDGGLDGFFNLVGNHEVLH